MRRAKHVRVVRVLVAKLEVCDAAFERFEVCHDLGDGGFILTHHHPDLAAWIRIERVLHTHAVCLPYPLFSTSGRHMLPWVGGHCTQMWECRKREVNRRANKFDGLQIRLRDVETQVRRLVIEDGVQEDVPGYLRARFRPPGMLPGPG